jgi:tRNA (guanine37-N1)-methyltransferase
VPLREFGLGRHRVVDDTPYGGGPGMVLKPEPIVAAVESIRRPESTVVLTTPRGRLFTQALARELAARPHLVLVCGHYEGVDERVVAVLGAEEVSIGDFVLTGGELPAMVIVDAVARLLPGALGAEASPVEESHSAGLLEYPQYTRPVEFRGLRVPAVLLGGNHAAIARWRRLQSLVLTLTRRPELLRPEHWAELRLLALAGELPGPEGWGEGAAGESSGGR